MCIRDRGVELAEEAPADSAAAAPAEPAAIVPVEGGIQILSLIHI